MGEIQTKRFDEPDEVFALPNQITQVVVLGETYVSRTISQPGWSWSKDVKPVVGTPSCQIHHQGVVLSGFVEITTNEGARRRIGPGEAYDIQPGHNGFIVGDEPCIAIEFHGVRDWGKPRLGARVLTTLLFTDIVGSTTIAERLGDAAWKDLLARHYDRVRGELERYRGEESKTTGDGILALFDGTARAALCAAAICQVSRQDGLEVRVAVHSGEVERYPDSVQGLHVHVAARIMGLAGPGEVLLSAATVSMLEGSGLSFIDAGEHELKGLGGSRRLYRLAEVFPKIE